MTSEMCVCDTIFKQFKDWSLTMKGMKSVATKHFIPQAFNKWVCKKCEKVHTKDW
jgi:hypothetical protein